MMDETAVRGLTRSDIPGWIEMRAALWPDERESIEREGDGPLHDGGIPLRVFVATRDSELVGFIEISLRPYAEGCVSSPVPYIEGWFVSEAHRGSGVGRALVDAALDWARSEGYEEIASDILATNEKSRAAHEALGFEEVETITIFRRRTSR